MTATIVIRNLRVGNLALPGEEEARQSEMRA